MEIPMHPDECAHGNTHIEGVNECVICQRDSFRAQLESITAENDAMRSSLMHACELSRDTMENHRELWAIRQVANEKGVPFSHARVEARYAEYPQALDEVKAQLAETARERDAANSERDRLRNDRDSYARSDFERQLSEVRADVDNMKTIYEAALEWREGLIPISLLSGHYSTRDLHLARQIDDSLGRSVLSVLKPDKGPVDKEAERMVDAMMAKAIESAPKRKLTMPALTSEERETLASLRAALSRCTWIEGAEWSVIKASIAVIDRLLEIK